MFKAYTIDGKIDEDEGLIEEVSTQLEKQINEIFELPEKDILEEVITRNFGQVFQNQINSLTNDEKIANLSLKIKGKKINISFRNNKCVDIYSEIPLLHQVVYIDNPFVLDQLGCFNLQNPMDRHLIDLLTENSDDIMDGIFGSVIAKEKLDGIYELLGNVVGGKLSQKNDEEFFIDMEQCREPLSVSNLSAGLKSFVIIKILLEKALLKEKDIIVLDEPEIHLHPQWQIQYAELIVLLQKVFDLTIIVVTHSPYFMDAIDLYSQKYGVEKKCNYYLADVQEGRAKMQCVTEEIERIYQKMITPVEALETLRNEMNCN